ncbi:MAG: sulfatase-like hydrolase/transferase, partial [Colwellia sp.]|nr:sulfatase-like hydrolase/transferase [Colwellia sp.]
NIMKENGYLVGLMGKDPHSTPYVPYEWEVMGTDKESKDPIEIHREATEAFSQAKDAGKPFFYMYNTHDPHRAFWGINKNLEINENQTPRPSHVYAYDDVSLPPSIPDIYETHLEAQYYFSTLRRGDDLITQVLAALDESGMADNTLVIFYSDHGWAMPFAKTNLYNASTRTPLIVRWPGKVEPGSVNSTEMVSAIDFLPTILDAAGIDIPAQVEGHSVKPLLLGESQPEVDRSRVFKTYYENSGHTRRPMRAIQTPEYNYIFNPWSDGINEMASTTQKTASFIKLQEAGETDAVIKARTDFYTYRVLEEFYVHADDQYEVDNKIADPAYQAIITELQNELIDWMIETNDPALPAFLKKDDANYLANWLVKQQDETKALGTKLGRSKTETVFYPNNDYFNIRSGETLSVATEAGVTGNDYFAVGATGIEATIVSQPAHGVVTLETDGSFTYVPNTDFYGEDSFVYQADSIGTSDSDTATVYITVVGENNSIDTPVVNNAPSAITLSTNSATEAEAYSATLFATDDDGDSLTFTKISGVNWLNVVDDQLVGTPTDENIGNNNIIVSVNDGESNTETTLTVTVIAAANTAPSAPTLSNSTGTANEAFTATLAASDVETASADLTFTSTALPAGLTLSGNTISGTPTAAGTTSVTVTVTDEGGLTANSAFTIVIAA